MDSNINNYNLTQITNKTINNTTYMNNNHVSTNFTSYTPSQTLQNAKVESVSFDPEIKTYLPTDVPGFYGGSQGTLNSLRMKKLFSTITIGIVSMSDYEKRHLNTYYEILNKYGISKKTDQTYMMVMIEDHGCGFVTMANIIADFYKDNPVEFERIYGFPLYDTNEDGNKVFNYDYILLDIFLKNKTKDDKQYDVRTSNYEEILRNSFPSQTVSVQTTPRDISIETYKQYIKSGNYQYASIAVSDYSLKPYGNNTDKAMSSKGGHLMTITGISENGNFIVSSWGKEWELTKGTPYNSFEDGGLFFITIGGN